MALTYRKRDTDYGYSYSWTNREQAPKGCNTSALIFARVTYYRNPAKIEFLDAAGNVRKTYVLRHEYNEESREIKNEIQTYYSNLQPKEEQMSKSDFNTTALYIVRDADGKERGYAKFLNFNSKHQPVVEFKDGTIEPVDKEFLEEVFPYTVDVSFDGEGSSSYAYFAHEGSVEVGDYVFGVSAGNRSGIARVIRVNTKSRLATKWLEGQVIVGRKIGEAYPPLAKK